VLAKEKISVRVLLVAASRATEGEAMRRKPKDLTDYKPLVLAIDPTAKLISWNGEAPKGYWVTGEKFGGWETKVTYSEARAWALAYEEVAR